MITTPKPSGKCEWPCDKDATYVLFDLCVGYKNVCEDHKPIPKDLLSRYKSPAIERYLKSFPRPIGPLKGGQTLRLKRDKKNKSWTFEEQKGKE